jgi:hypothetical protein
MGLLRPLPQPGRRLVRHGHLRQPDQEPQAQAAAAVSGRLQAVSGLAGDGTHVIRRGSRSRGAAAFGMSRREMLREGQVAASLMAQRTAYGALGLAHRRFQPGPGVGIQLARLRRSGQPRPPSHRQFGHEKLVLAFALFAPAASRPGQHGAVWRQRGRQVAPCGHTSTVGQRRRYEWCSTARVRSTRDLMSSLSKT